ncbi:mucin-binding protein [Limosilactobacillus antri]|uniref:mucin-binding protein n=1 Tax=Limosilactobacillus antri TaxID=227943 RepID=UPI001F5A87B8|nr:LPXTG cell wall anchor domain-containing protein [Limosilactobacillus antri]
MAERKRFKLYKQKKEWVIGCSTLFLSLTLGAVDVQAADNSPSANGENPATAANPAVLADRQTPSLASTNQQELVSAAPKTRDQSVSNQAAPTEATQQAANNTNQATAPASPVTTTTGPSSSDHPDDWSNNYERIITINYFTHYDLDGGSTEFPVQKRIIQMAVNGHWDAVDWLPPEGTFPPGVTVPPVHFDATDEVTKANQHWQVNFLFRIFSIQSATGEKTLSQVFVLTNGQTVTIPPIEITNQDYGIPTGYHPTMLYPTIDNVVEQNGHYYITEATITVDSSGYSVTYHGALNDITGLSSFATKIVFTAPLNFVYKDLNGNTYSVAGKGPAVFNGQETLNYSQTLTTPQILYYANQFLDQYRMGIAGNYLLYGFFGPDGKFNQLDGISLSDAVANNQTGFTFNLAIVNQVYAPVPGSQTTKTRTIILHKPTGDEQVSQQVGFQDFANFDQITGKQLSPAELKVLTGSDQSQASAWSALTVDNHSWAEYPVPAIANYTSSQSTVAAQTVTPDTSNQTVEIYYTAKTEKFTDTKQVVRTIKVQAPDGTVHATEQTVTFTRSGVKNLATGVTDWDDWQPSSSTWPAFTVPQYPGYTADVDTVAAQAVDATTSDQTVVVTYQAVVPVQPDQPGTGGTGQLPLPGQPGNPASNRPGTAGISGQAVAKAASQQAALPQTGSQSNEGLVALGSLALLTLFGLAGRKKFEHSR